MSKNCCFAIQRQAYFCGKKTALKGIATCENYYEKMAVKRLSCVTLLNGSFCKYTMSNRMRHCLNEGLLVPKSCVFT